MKGFVLLRFVKHKISSGKSLAKLLFRKEKKWRNKLLTYIQLWFLCWNEADNHLEMKICIVTFDIPR